METTMPKAKKKKKQQLEIYFSVTRDGMGHSEKEWATKPLNVKIQTITRAKAQKREKKRDEDYLLLVFPMVDANNRHFNEVRGV